MSARPTTPRVVKLQVNTTGAWRNVLDFDCEDENAVLHAAEELFQWQKGAKLRCIIPGDTAPLMLWDFEAGWVDWGKA